MPQRRDDVFVSGPLASSLPKHPSNSPLLHQIDNFASGSSTYSDGGGQRMMTNGSLFSSICKKSRARVFESSSFWKATFIVHLLLSLAIACRLLGFLSSQTIFQVVLMNHLSLLHQVWYTSWAPHWSVQMTKPKVGRKKRKTKQKQRGKKSCRTRETWRVLFLGHLICIYGHRLCRHYYY